MNLSQKALQLTKLIGKKELEFGCLVQWLSTKEFGTVAKASGTDFYIVGSEREYCSSHIEIIGSPCTIDDLFRWAKSKNTFINIQTENFINYYLGIAGENIPYREISYIETHPLYSQSDETLQQIIDLIKQ